MEIVEVEPLRLVHEHNDDWPKDDYYRFEPDGEATRFVIESEGEMPGRMPGFIKDLVIGGWAERQHRKILADLSLGTSVHVLPDVWDQAIIQLAASYGFDYTNEIERAAYYRRVTGQFVREQRSRMSSNLYDRSEPMAPIGGEIN